MNEGQDIARSEPQTEDPASGPASGAGPGRRSSRDVWFRRPFNPPTWLQAGGLLALCAILFITGLGDRGLAYSEGHRVGPAWEMLDAGPPGEAADAWLAPRLFGAVYLRKPPGMSWAIAISSGLLGRTELAARLPSALAMAVLVLVSWRVTTRWIGSPWGLGAGLAQALFPVFWPSARSAEIEMLHAAGAGSAALLIADVMLRSGGRRWMAALGAGLGVSAMVLTKGPAALPLIVAIPLGVCLARRSVSPLAHPALALVLVIPGLIVGVTAWGVQGALERADGHAITQGVGEFLWEPSKILRVLTLPFAAWGTMMPAALGLLVVLWNPNRPGCASVDSPRGHADLIARALGLSWLAAVAMYTLIGVSNPRYLLPTAALLPPIVAVGMAGLRVRAEAGGFTWFRRGIARVLALGWTGSWVVVLMGGFVAFIALYEAPRGRTSGDAAGAALGAILDPASASGQTATATHAATVWADELAECRPEVLLYARKWAPLLRIRWIKPLDAAPLGAGDVVIVRTDRHGLGEGEPTERDRCGAVLAGAVLIHQFAVHKYSFEVYRIAGSAAREAVQAPVNSDSSAPPAP